MNEKAGPASPEVRAVIEQSGVLSSTRVIGDLNDELQKDESTFESILNAIRADEPLARRVIAVANSAWFGGRVKSETVEVAFGRLGIEDFYKVVVAAALRFHLGDAPEYKKWWAQSETTARLGELLAQQLDPGLIEPAFFIGLLHDCAVPLLARQVADYSYLMDEALGHSSAGAEMELECNRFTHCDVGAELVTAWRFPGVYADVVRHHHGLSVECMADDPDRRLLSILMLAKRIEHWCNHEGAAGFADSGESALELEIANVFRLTRGQLADVVNEMIRMYRLRQSQA